MIPVNCILVSETMAMYITDFMRWSYDFFEEVFSFALFYAAVLRNQSRRGIEKIHVCTIRNNIGARGL